MRLVFSFIVGNSDMHLKNLSLIEKSPRSLIYVLSPAYDILPVNIVNPGDNEDMALTLNGKKSHLRKKDFVAFGVKIGLSEPSMGKMMKDICRRKNAFLRLIDDSLLPEEMKASLASLLEDRCLRLGFGEADKP